MRILKELREPLLVSADSKELADGQFRPKPGKTRCLLVSADSKGLTAGGKRKGENRKQRDPCHPRATMQMHGRKEVAGGASWKLLKRKGRSCSVGCKEAANEERLESIEPFGEALRVCRREFTT